MFKLYYVPFPDENEPAFCHECAFVFDVDDSAYIDLDRGVCLCEICYCDDILDKKLNGIKYDVA